MMAKQIFLPSDGPTGTPSLRTLGTGATQAAAGNAAPNAHASTHVGSDSILAYMAAAMAQLTGHLMVPYPPQLAGSGITPGQGQLKMTKLLTPYAFTINTIDLIVRVAGTGVTSLANCFVAIFDSSGQRQYVSADQASAWATTGTKTVTVSGGYTVTAGSYIYLALLVGTQSTTAMQNHGVNPAINDPWTVNQIAATYGSVQTGSSLTSVPSSITLSSNVASSGAIWFGVR